MAVPRRGEVWIVDLGYQGKARPALIISREFGDIDRALITVVPHTTAIRNSEFEVPIDARFLAKPGAFMTQGIASIPTVNATKQLGKLSPEQLVQVEAKVRLWLML